METWRKPCVEQLVGQQMAATLLQDSKRGQSTPTGETLAQKKEPSQLGPESACLAPHNWTHGPRRRMLSCGVHLSPQRGVVGFEYLRISDIKQSYGMQ